METLEIILIAIWIIGIIKFILTRSKSKYQSFVFLGRIKISISKSLKEMGIFGVLIYLVILFERLGIIYIVIQTVLLILLNFKFSYLKPSNISRQNLNNEEAKE